LHSWEVGRGILVKGESVCGGSLGKRNLSGVTASCHWMFESGNVSSEGCRVSVEVVGGPLGLQGHEVLIECRRGCLWVVHGEMKVGAFLLLIYRVFPAVGSQVECGQLSLGMLCRSDR